MVNRGQTWWADSQSPTGSEQGFNRPVLVVQADRFNQSRIGTVVITAITSNVRFAKAPGNNVIAKNKSGLSKGTVINVSHVSTLDKESSTEAVGNADRLIMHQVDEGSRLLLCYVCIRSRVLASVRLA
jgi:mRNA interferase MazF